MKVRSVGRKFVAGIDLGACMGVSKVFSDGRIEVYSKKLKNDYEARLDALEEIIRELDSTDCLGVVIENPMGRHYNVLRMHMQLLGAVMMGCHLRGIRACAVNLKEVKKSATGKGNADKAAMIEAAYERFGKRLDEHEADAAHCAAYGWDTGLFE